MLEADWELTTQLSRTPLLLAAIAVAVPAPNQARREQWPLSVRVVQPAIILPTHPVAGLAHSTRALTHGGLARLQEKFSGRADIPLPPHADFPFSRVPAQDWRAHGRSSALNAKQFGSA